MFCNGIGNISPTVLIIFILLLTGSSSGSSLFGAVPPARGYCCNGPTPFNGYNCGCGNYNPYAYGCNGCNNGCGCGGCCNG